MEIEVKIKGFLLDPVSSSPIVVLQRLDDKGLLPIWISPELANAIAFELEKQVPPRPQTHDLIRNIVGALDASVSKVVVTELKDDTFFSILWLERAGQTISLDLRPSDALAIALRVDCPVYVEEQVFTAAGAHEDQSRDSQIRQWLENLGDEGFGSYKM